MNIWVFYRSLYSKLLAHDEFLRFIKMFYVFKMCLKKIKYGLSNPHRNSKHNQSDMLLLTALYNLLLP